MRVAHVVNNKVVNISVWDKMPEGKQYLAANEDTAIGDAVKDGKLVAHPKWVRGTLPIFPEDRIAALEAQVAKLTKGA